MYAKVSRGCELGAFLTHRLHLDRSSSPAIEPVKGGHLLLRETPSTCVCVPILALSAHIRALGQWYHRRAVLPVLELPAEHDLSGRLASLRSDGAKRLVLVVVATGQRAVGLYDDVVLGAGSSEWSLGEEGVAFNLEAKTGSGMYAHVRRQDRTLEACIQACKSHSPG